MNANTPNRHPSLRALPSNATLPSPVECVNKVIESGGSIHLAAELLHITTDKLTAIICSDPASYDLFSSQVRTKILLDMTGFLFNIQLVLQERLPTMTTTEIVKTFQSMTELSVAMITANKQPPTADVIFNMLPPQAAEALRSIMSSNTRQASASTSASPSRHLPMLDTDESLSTVESLPSTSFGVLDND